MSTFYDNKKLRKAFSPQGRVGIKFALGIYLNAEMPYEIHPDHLFPDVS